MTGINSSRIPDARSAHAVNIGQNVTTKKLLASPQIGFDVNGFWWQLGQIRPWNVVGTAVIVPCIARLAAHSCTMNCVAAFDVACFARLIFARLILAVSLFPFHARENLMPKRVTSFVPMVLSVSVPLIPALFFVAVVLTFVATIATFTYGPARADSACITQPSPPAAEGSRWYLRYDRTKGRRCWVLGLASANAHEVATPQGQTSAAAAPTLSSRLAELFGGLVGSSTNVAPQANAAQSNLTSAPRKTPGNSPNAAKPDKSDRADQRDIVEGHAGKRAPPALTQPERNALFEEFLRWHESQQNINRSTPLP